MNASILQGDCLTILPTLPDKSFQTCVTSPPFFGLRDYGTAQWDGGDSTCNHKVGNQVADRKAPGAITSGVRPGADASHCKRCGAKRIDRQLGLEPTPDEYVTNLVSVFREVRRLLRDDGTCWLNLGDSYASNWPCNRRNQIGQGSLGNGKRENRAPRIGPGLKDKDLIGIPWRVAFALQDDGWWLRSDIIWHKTNPIPESVKDRPTSAHDHVFLLSKRKRYFYDQDAIREPPTGRKDPITGFGHGADRRDQGRVYERDGSIGANARNVWKISIRPFQGAHFATMPLELAEKCIKAGSRPGDMILDPFAGSGTTGLAAQNLGRSAVLVELNTDYCAIIEDRLGGK